MGLAGLKILRVINEPTAAAMAYGLHKVDVFYVLVIDLGGGTLDVSLLNKQGGMFLTRAMSGKERAELKRFQHAFLNMGNMEHIVFYFQSLFNLFLFYVCEYIAACVLVHQCVLCNAHRVRRRCQIPLELEL